MTDAFVSYSRKDKAFTRKLVSGLQQSGKSIWIDWENIPLTADWMKEIEAGIEAADNFIFIITPDSVKSEVCLREIQYADKHNKRFVPILHKELEDTEQNRNLHPSISSHNWIFFRDEDPFEEAERSLISILETDLDYVKAHTRLLTRAVEWDNKGRDNSFLLRGNELQEALVTIERGATREPEITRLQEEYISSSQAAERLRRTIRILMGVVTIAFVSAVVAAGVAIWQFTEAERQREIVQELSLAANSRVALLNDNRDLAISLIMNLFEEEVGNAEVRIESEFALANAAYSPGTTLVYDGHRESLDGYLAEILAADPEATAEIAVSAVAVSPDGQLVLSGDTAGQLQLWERETGTLIRTFEETEMGRINNIVFAPDPGQNIAVSVSVDGIARVWDTETGQELRRFEQHGDNIQAVTFSTDGQWVVTGGDDLRVYVWDVNTAELVNAFVTVNGPVVDLDYHPHANIVLIMALNTPPTLWNVDTNGSRAFSSYLPSLDNLRDGAAVFNSDGTRVLSSSAVEMRYWNLETGELIFEMTGHGSNINDIAIGPNDEFAISSAWRENSIRMWDMRTGVELALFNGHDGVMERVDITPSGLYALSASADKTLRVWELTNGALIRIYDDGPTDDIFDVDYHPSGESVVTVGVDPIIYHIDLTTGEILDRLEGEFTERVWTVQFDPSGEHVFAGGNEGFVVMWNIETGAVRRFTGHEDDVTTLDISPDGSLLLTGSNDRTVRLWDIATGDPIGEPFTFGDSLRSVVFSPDAMADMFVVGAGSQILLYDRAEGTLIREFVGHTNRVNTLAFNTDATRLASGGGDGSVRIWNVNTGDSIHVMRGHQSQVRSVQFGQNDRRILSSSADTTLRLWDVRTGLEVRRFEGHADWVNQAVLSPDGRRAVSGAWDETLRTWFIHDVRSLAGWTRENRYVRDLTCEESRIYLLQNAAACEAP